MISRLRPDSATMVGVLTAAGVYLIFNGALPSITDVRAADPDDNDVDKARKQAVWKSTVLIGAVFFVSRDLNSYIISGAALTGIDLMYKHANAVHPVSGTVDTTDDMSSDPAGLATAMPLPSYSDSDDDYS